MGGGIGAQPPLNQGNQLFSGGSAQDPLQSDTVPTENKIKFKHPLPLERFPVYGPI